MPRAQLANNYLAQLDVSSLSLARRNDIVYDKRYIDDGIAIIKLDY